jgi:hypothetical protein
MRSALLPARPLRARSRGDLLCHARRVMETTAPRWSRGDETSVVVHDPQVTPEDVRIAWEQVCEKLHVEGVELELEQRGDELLAVFRASQ